MSAAPLPAPSSFIPDDRSPRPRGLLYAAWAVNVAALLAEIATVVAFLTVLSVQLELSEGSESVAPTLIAAALSVILVITGITLTCLVVKSQAGSRPWATGALILFTIVPALPMLLIGFHIASNAIPR
ncbi:hypothetical protein [Gordonia caeni]|uniref:DUF805 domain-containing protein n=1 Tax=Gordonia caeni TaxID=1007097 RepID=A0ABP7PMP0_9ACTN